MRKVIGLAVAVAAGVWLVAGGMSVVVGLVAGLATWAAYGLAAGIAVLAVWTAWRLWKRSRQREQGEKAPGAVHGVQWIGGNPTASNAVHISLNVGK